MLPSWIAKLGVQPILRWIGVFVCLASVPLPDAQAQSLGERWVTLATREVDTKAERVSIDLSKAKGAFRAVRVSLRAGALALTQIELRYDGAPVHTARRAVVLRPNQRPQLIDSHNEDRFLDSLLLAFRAVPGELDRATLVVEGLQTPSGAAAVRGRPPPAVSQAPKSAEPAKPTPAETEAKARSREEVSGARHPPPPRHPLPVPARRRLAHRPRPQPPRPDCDQSDPSARCCTATHAQRHGQQGCGG